MNVSLLKPSDKNPRYIREHKFQQVIDSILLFPEMLTVRGIVFSCEGDMSAKNHGIVRAGNQRLRAIIKLIEFTTKDRNERIAKLLNKQALTEDELEQRLLHLKEFWSGIARSKELPGSWVKDVTEWTDAQIQEFTIRDNAHSGEWDMEALANEWDAGTLKDWGLEVPVWTQRHEANRMSEEDVSEDQEFDVINASDGRHRVVFFFDGEEEAQSWLDQYPAMIVSKKAKKGVWSIDLSTGSI